jgi:hypothetical protein
MLVGKLSDVRHSVCHLSADGVVEGKRGIAANVLLYVFNNAPELIKGLGCL